MLNKLPEKKLLLLLLTSLFLLFFLLSFFSEGTFDSGDGIRHYMVSRYSWKHPELLLYSWGKPFFTFVSSPFSQFGLIGVNVFNLLCALLSSLLCFKIAQLLKLTYPFLVILFLFFTPIYFPTINSGLTEPLFGLVLIASVYFMFREKYLWAALLVSFLPFVRTEGNLVLPFFFVVLAYRKKILYTPLLACGTIVYSIIGYFYYNDIFWLKHQNPYTGSNYNIYGKGDLLHFVNSYHYIWGRGLVILFILGCAAILFLIVSGIKNRSKQTENKSFLTEELFLIYGSFFVYFVAHSIFWWKGLAGSLGLIRVLAGVIPCSALICLRGFNLIMLPFFRRSKFIETGIILVSLFFILSNPFKQDYFPYRLDTEQSLVKDAGDWFRSSPYTKQKVYYLYPFLAHVLNVDSFDPNKVGELWGLYPMIKVAGISTVPDSSVIFWDGHFGPNECAIPLDSILNDTNFQLVKSFHTKEKYLSLDGSDFAIYVFIKPKHAQKMMVGSSDFYDLENLGPNLLNTMSLDTTTSFSGKRSCRLSEKDEYSVTAKRLISEVPKGTINVDFSCMLSDPDNNSKDALVVMSVDDDSGKNLFWSGKPLMKNEKSGSKWKSYSARFTESLDIFPPASSIKFYIWNKAKRNFFVDDIKIDYWGY